MWVPLFSNGTFRTPDRNKTMVADAEQSHGVPTPIPEHLAVQTATKTVNKRMRRKHNKWTLIITFVSLVLIIILITIAFLVAKGLLVENDNKINPPQCDVLEKCNVELVETIPSVLVYDGSAPKHTETAKAWLDLINMASRSIKIVSFYWTLTSDDVKPGSHFPQAAVGMQILNGLKAAADRGVKIQIVQTKPTELFQNKDTAELAQYSPNIVVRSLDMNALLKAGIVHTKTWIVDEMHMYVGSANFDWRSLTEVKELGTALYNCSCAGEDLNKIFLVNWDMAQKGATIPNPWPEQYRTKISKDNPQTLPLVTGSSFTYYWSTSPPQFCAGDRTSDIDSIVNNMERARKFVNIAVMDYVAAIKYQEKKKFYSVIDNEIRKIVYENGINVRMLMSNWSSTDPQQIYFLRSLKEFGNMPKMEGSITIKLFNVPPNYTIPFSRVNHNKYMVTDNTAFISTSNWSGDYFVSTGGISFTVDETSMHDTTRKTSIHNETLRQQLLKVFDRDWDSKYSTNI